MPKNDENLVIEISRVLGEEFSFGSRKAAHWLNSIHPSLPVLNNKTPQELIDGGEADLVLSVLIDILDRRERG